MATSHPTIGGELVLALDQGTTNAKAILVDAASGAVLARGARPVAITYPAPGAVEQDAEDIWNATTGAVADCLAAAGDAAAAAIRAVAISNQRESVVAWDAATGEPLGPVLGWQDARTAAACDAIRDAAGLVRSRAGLDLDPMFSAPKMRWLLDHVGRADGVRLGTIDTFLVERLTGAFTAEAGNASRTLLLDLAQQRWDPELLDLFGVPVTCLAPVVASDTEVGRTRAGLPLPAGIPVLAVLADSHAALYFHSGGRPGEGKATFGTGSSVMVAAAATTAPAGVASTLAWSTRADGPTFAREGNVVASGAALAWAARLLTGGDVVALGSLAASVPDADGAAFVPAFSGLGAPYFDRGATGLIAGITGGTTPAHLARAAFDGVAHQVADVVEAIESDGEARLAVLHADGGATGSELLMQTQADLLGRTVHVSRAAEASALGAALLAARALGALDAGAAWTAHDASGGRTAEPAIDPDHRAARRTAWARAVNRSRGLAVAPVAAATQPSPADPRATPVGASALAPAVPDPKEIVP